MNPSSFELIIKTEIMKMSPISEEEILICEIQKQLTEKDTNMLF